MKSEATLIHTWNQKHNTDSQAILNPHIVWSFEAKDTVNTNDWGMEWKCSQTSGDCALWEWEGIGIGIEGKPP